MNTLDQFRNEVFCRRGSNQLKARKLWGELKNTMDPKNVSSFEIEWEHYLLGEFDAQTFASYFKEFVLGAEIDTRGEQSHGDIARNICNSQEHNRLVAWYGRCAHCKETKMK